MPKHVKESLLLHLESQGHLPQKPEPSEVQHSAPEKTVPPIEGTRGPNSGTNMLAKGGLGAGGFNHSGACTAYGHGGVQGPGLQRSQGQAFLVTSTPRSA